MDFNLMAVTLWEREKKKLEDERLPLEEILKMLGINKIDYEAWYRQKTSQLEGNQTLSESEKAWEDDKELMIKIVQRVSYVPGVRSFRAMFWNYYERNVSIKRVRKLMKALNLVAYKRKRDAYKHQATHNHPFTAPCGNIVNRDFYLAPRRVVCTDITYVYFGKNRETHYVCCFKDAYTTEILGWASSATMDTGLVVKAYEMMMSKHGDELRKAKVLIHSDQGSQYCSLEYRNKLDDCFVQSMSRRGNSLDNYPIESFFGLFKGMALDTIALCKERSQVDAMVDSVIDTYNNRPQDQLACLTPSQYYDYATTGIYPLSSYFGVDASELRNLYELREDREAFAANEAKRRKERFAGMEAMERRNKEADEKIKAAQATPMGKIDPLERIKTDRKCTQKHYQDNHKKLEEKAELEVRYEVLQNLIDVAEDYVKSVSPDVFEELRSPENWKYHTELSYIYEMDEMF